MKEPTLDTLIAHSAGEGGTPQTLHDHLKNVAELAARFAGAFGAGRFGAWLGWWHDAGKCAPDVQAYLRGETDAPRGPDHSSAGMLEANRVDPPLAFNVAGHHGGLSDRERLRERIARKEAEPRVVAAQHLAEKLLAGLPPEIAPGEIPPFVRTSDPKAASRRLAFWLRMVHSALVDADCLDTERHFQPDKASLRRVEVALSDLWPRFERKQRALTAGKTGPVNEVRRAVYEACLARAGDPPGIFALTAPTGAGKTRSAMAFALRHALAHGKRRVIVALPYTSIIEQNADVYRDLFGAEAVLEHHSAVSGKEQPGAETAAERWARLAAENWDAPVIVTTTVQLFESLFANRNSRCRKLHNVAGSVLILDEVQTLPPRLLRPTLEAMEHLVEVYGVTLVLSTATQPALQARPGFPGLSRVREILPDPAWAFDRLRRVRYEIDVKEPWPWARVAETLFEDERAMAVLNTIRDAMTLMDEVQGRGALHLSTRLCGAHRRVVLAEVRRRLAERRSVHLVSTQVVEAGVDLDFPLVLRALGPLDRIIQAAGRCNREGRLEAGRVVVFSPEEGGLPPGAYRIGTGVTRTLLAADPPPDLDDPALPMKYFRMLYHAMREELDDANVLEKWAGLKFEEVARAYRLIEDDTVSVVAPYDPPGRAGAREAVLERIRRQGRAFHDDYRALQPYLVSLRARAHEQAVARGLCEEWAPGVWIWHGVYDDVRGLQMELPLLDDPVI